MHTRACTYTHTHTHIHTHTHTFTYFLVSISIAILFLQCISSHITNLCVPKLAYWDSQWVCEISWVKGFLKFWKSELSCHEVSGINIIWVWVRGWGGVDKSSFSVSKHLLLQRKTHWVLVIMGWCCDSSELLEGVEWHWFQLFHCSREWLCHEMRC